MNLIRKRRNLVINKKKTIHRLSMVLLSAFVIVTIISWSDRQNDREKRSYYVTNPAPASFPCFKMTREQWEMFREKGKGQKKRMISRFSFNSYPFDISNLGVIVYWSRRNHNGGSEADIIEPQSLQPDQKADPSYNEKIDPNKIYIYGNNYISIKKVEDVINHVPGGKLPNDGYLRFAPTRINDPTNNDLDGQVIFKIYACDKNGSVISKFRKDETHTDTDDYSGSTNPSPPKTPGTN